MYVVLFVFSGVEVAREGPCAGSVMYNYVTVDVGDDVATLCIDMDDPVCAANGKVYDNRCVAKSQ